MKKVLLALTLMVAAVSYGQTEKGNWMVGSNVGLNLNSGNLTGKVKEHYFEANIETKTTLTTFILNPDVSYFLGDNLAVGVGLDYQYSKVSVSGSLGRNISNNSSSIHSFGIMPNIKYFFPQGKVAPFVGLGVGYRMDNISPEDGDSETIRGLSARVEGGLAYFLTSSLAATASARYEYSSLHSSSSDGNFQNQRSLFGLGIIGVAYFF